MALFGCSREPVQPHDPIPAPSSASGASRIGGAIALQGAITPQMARDFLLLLNSGRTKAVMVRSGGGDDQSAMTIGWAIHSRGLPLIVQGACMSACAHFIFVAASRRFVQPSSYGAWIRKGSPQSFRVPRGWSLTHIEGKGKLLSLGPSAAGNSIGPTDFSFTYVDTGKLPYWQTVEHLNIPTWGLPSVGATKSDGPLTRSGKPNHYDGE